MNSITAPNELIEVARRLSADFENLSPQGRVTHIYNPLTYAWLPHRLYLERWGGGVGKETLLLGMNPGPWGMAQTGVPFGEVNLVRDWLGVEAKVGKPPSEHPKRPIDGFLCRRSEVSGRRLWGWARDRFETADRFFSQFFVYNYCPLLFLEGSGRNSTPDRFPAVQRQAIEGPCDRALLHTVSALGVIRVVGVGRFAQQCAARALRGTEVEVGMMPHPSPASPQANKGWSRLADAALSALGMDL